METGFRAFTVLITKLSRSIRRIKSEEMAEFQLKGPHVSCLYYLYRTDGLTAAELSEQCEEDKAAISRSLEYLEAQGYLTCAARSSKRYRSPLKLTEKGNAAAAAITEKIDRIVSRANEGLTDSEREGMYRALTVISRNLELIYETYDKKEEHP